MATESVATPPPADVAAALQKAADQLDDAFNRVQQLEMLFRAISHESEEPDNGITVGSLAESGEQLARYLSDDMSAQAMNAHHACMHREDAA